MQQQTAYYNTFYTGSQTDVTGLCPEGFVLPTRDDFTILDKSLGGNGQSIQYNTSLVAHYTNSALYNGIFSGLSLSSGTLDN